MRASRETQKLAIHSVLLTSESVRLAARPRASRKSEGVMVRPIATGVTVVSLLSLAFVPPLGAQGRDERAGRGAFTAGASFGDGETALALSAALAFTFSSRAGLDVELAYARELDFTLDLCPAPRICILDGQLPVTGRTLSLVPHLVIELGPASRRVRAYAQAGVGAGHLRQRYVFDPPPSGSLVSPTELTRSSLVPALSVGGGAAMPLWRRLTLSADVRSLHLFDDQPDADRFIVPAGTLRTLRAGVRVGWQF